MCAGSGEVSVAKNHNARELTLSTTRLIYVKRVKTVPIIQKNMKNRLKASLVILNMSTATVGWKNIFHVV